MSAPSSPKVGGASPKASSASPKVGGASGSASPKAPKGKADVPEMDTSIGGWIYNIRTVLHFPGTVITVIALLISGAFIESASRKSLEMLDNVFGKILGFVVPIAIAYALDWQTVEKSPKPGRQTK